MFFLTSTAETFCLGDQPGNLMRTQSRSHIVGLPKTEAQKVAHIGCIGCFDELSLQRGQCLGVLADQQGIGHIQNMAVLRTAELNVELVEKRT
jgi:hypothetical protein